VRQAALWGERIGHEDADGVKIGRVCDGHTPTDRQTGRLGNVYRIDTRSVFGLLAEDSVWGHLAVAGLAGHSKMFDAASPLSVADARPDVEPATDSFGAYAQSRPVGVER